MSKPRLNTDVGYWYCETADRSDAGWDYCCSPDNQCGYSDGYEYPWYVGVGRDSMTMNQEYLF